MGSEGPAPPADAVGLLSWAREGRRFAHVDAMEGFVLMGTDEPGVSEAFATCRQRFQWLIYDPTTGLPRSEDICRGLREGFAFAVGSKRSTDVIDEDVPRLFGQYVITMRVPEWPHRPGWTGEFAAEELTKPSSRRRGSQVATYDGFTSSLWRPDNFCACWEETFHCITEAVRRLAASDEAPYASQWLFTRDSQLGRLMLADIAAGDYEIRQQQEAERDEGGSGGYDFETAVNEWLHQCWVCHYAGHVLLLSEPKLRALEIMRRTPGFPFRVHASSASL